MDVAWLGNGMEDMTMEQMVSMRDSLGADYFDAQYPDFTHLFQ